MHNNKNQTNLTVTELSLAELNQVSGGSDMFSNTKVTGGGSLSSFGLGVSQTVPLNNNFDLIFKASGNNHQGITFGGVNLGFKW